MYDSNEQQNGRWVNLPHVRSPLVVALAAVAPALAMGLLAIISAIIFKFMEKGLLPTPSPRILLVVFCVLVAHVLMGFAVGINVPPVVAVPSVLLLDYGWMVLPPALQPFWIRHVTGIFLCCIPDTTLAPSAVYGSLTVAGGLLASAVWLLLRQPLSKWKIAVALIPIVLSFAVGRFLAKDLGHSAIAPRSPSVLVCSESRPQVCLWPEHRHRLQEVVDLATRASQSWEAFGLNVPLIFSEQGDLIRTTRGFGLGATTSHYLLLNSLSNATLPAYPECRYNGVFRHLGEEAEDYLLAWLNATASMPQSELESRFDADVLQTVCLIQTLSIEKQRTWVEQNMNALAACDVEPQLEPPT